MSNKLLLADDSITIRKVVGIILANEDYSLTVVDNGNAALDKAREIVPDVILADVMMPGKNGYEVCEEIRKDPSLKHVPLLLLTGAFEPFDEDKARICGADDFISKPFESQQLLEKVGKLVELGKGRITAPVEPEPLIEPPQPVPFELPEEAFAGAAGGDFAQVEESVGETDFLVEAISSTEGIVEALPEDDLWGAFELEELTEDSPVEPEPVLAKEVEDPFAELAAMDLQSLGVEPAEPLPDLQPGASPLPAEEVAPSLQPAAEETFTLGEDLETDGFEMDQDEEIFSIAPEEEAVELEPASDEVFVLGAETETKSSDFAFDAPAAEAAPPPQEMELEFAPEEEYVPVLPATSPQAAEPMPAAACTAQPVAGGDVTLSEEQLASVIAKISRELIEKIAWEVVPDLAEMLIREEIRKIKKGIQD